MDNSKKPIVELLDVSSVKPRKLFDFQQKVLFSPFERGGEGFIKLAVTTGKKGAKSVAHSHPRDEVTLTLSGKALLRAEGKEHYLVEGVAVRIPPGVEHTVEVISEEWTVVSAYCDECSLCRAGALDSGTIEPLAML